MACSVSSIEMGIAHEMVWAAHLMLLIFWFSLLTKSFLPKSNYGRGIVFLLICYKIDSFRMKSLLIKCILTFLVDALAFNFSETLRMKQLYSAAVLLLGAAVVVSSTKDEDESKKEGVGTVIGIDLGTTYSWLVYYILLVRWLDLNCTWNLFVTLTITHFTRFDLVK